MPAEELMKDKHLGMSPCILGGKEKNEMMMMGKDTDYLSVTFFAEFTSGGSDSQKENNVIYIFFKEEGVRS